MKTAPTTFLKQLNERRVLNAIRIGQEVSRASLDRQLHLATPTVSRIVDRLIDEGFVCELGFADTAAGRPPRLLEINSTGIGAIGVELGRTRTRIIYANLRGEPQVRDEIATGALSSPQDLIDRIQKLIQTITEPNQRLLGIGIGTPGAYDSRLVSQRVTLGHNKTWKDVPLTDLIEDALDVPAYVANDANAAALAETWFGIGLDFSEVLFILGDVGIGAGMTVAGSIYEGASRRSGEFAHMVIDMQGDVCEQCHRQGCLDLIAAAPKIIRAVSQARSVGPEEGLADIILRAKTGLAPDAQVMANVMKALAIGIANYVLIFDPAVVIFGGQTMLDGLYVVEGVMQRLADEIEWSGRQVVMAPSKFGLNAVAVGAAALVLQKLYDHSELVSSSY